MGRRSETERWLGPRDSNPDSRLQRPGSSASWRWWALIQDENSDYALAGAGERQQRWHHVWHHRLKEKSLPMIRCARSVRRLRTVHSEASVHQLQPHTKRDPLSSFAAQP